MSDEIAKTTTKTPTWTILFQEPEITGKTAMRLCPDGTLTRKTIFAAMFKDRDRANSIAAELREQYPAANVKVRRF